MNSPGISCSNGSSNLNRLEMAFCSVTFSFSDCLHCPSVYEATTISSSVTIDSSSSVFSASTDFSEAESASCWATSLVSPPVLLFQALQAGLLLCSNHGCWRHSSAVARSLQRKESVKCPNEFEIQCLAEEIHTNYSKDMTVLKTDW